MKHYLSIWKMLWQRLWKAKLALLLTILLCQFLRWLAAPDTSSLLWLAGIGLGIFVLFDLAMAFWMYTKMKRSMPYYQFVEDFGPCEEAVDLHRKLFQNPKPGERLALADLLLSMFRAEEAEAVLMQLRPEGLIGIERLRYLNAMLLVYAYTGRKQQLWQMFQSCRQEAGRLTEKNPIFALSYFNTADLALAMNGDVDGSEMYCQYVEREAAKKRGIEKANAQLLAMITRTERLYALGWRDVAAAMETHTRTEIENCKEFRKAWKRDVLMNLLNHAKTLAPKPVPPAPSVK
ncbi:MAG: hypothetical protein IKQ39_08000 [Oscillospiraceae bacterium]|nr:hypothetical protein [Oscillospiraceae bacterium]